MKEKTQKKENNFFKKVKESKRKKGKGDKKKVLRPNCILKTLSRIKKKERKKETGTEK